MTNCDESLTTVELRRIASALEKANEVQGEIRDELKSLNQTMGDQINVFGINF